jgi:ATP-dependent Clp protease ATP-binding subunit ClpC
MTLHASTELRQVLAEASDIANQTSQTLTSAHMLLALFTVRNRAEILLKERKIDEDALLSLVHTVDGEPPGTVRVIQYKARQMAVGCGADTVDCLHLLIALCGARESLAYTLLKRTGLSIPQFRNTALSYVTGRIPRRLTVKQAEASAAPSAGPSKARALVTDIPSFPEVPPTEDAPEESFSPEGPADDEEEMEYSSSPPEKTSWDLEPTRFPLLSKLGRNITSLASIGRVDPLIGRDRQIEEMIDTLLKRRANNPVLVGEPGVGKTAIVEGLALRIVQGTPDTRQLEKRRIVELDVSSLLAGTQLRGAFSEKLLQIRDEVKKAEGSVIVFFDEMHTLMGAGATGDGPQDAANELKAALARGEFPCIGSTTHDEYRRFIEQDAAFSRRFHPIQVPEPSPEETVAILKGVAQEYAQHHGVSYDSAALEAAVHLSSRYITDRCLPDKAISLVDLAGSRARRSEKVRVDAEAVARVVSSVAGIPVERLLMTDTERLLNMEQIIGLQIIGHTPIIRSVARVIRRNYAGFAHRRPIGSFLFLGPTGVGKTETARALAQFLFGNRDALIKLDMSEYVEPHTVSRLVGSPPGYVGYQEGGQLTEAVRRRPYTIVLFDEVEKAHPEVQQLLLQILDEGRLTDGKGRTVDLTNTVIILTSNLGCEKLGRSDFSRIGFGAKAQAQEPDTSKDAMAAARRSFPPELWGRMDEQLFFRPLDLDDLCSIAALVIKESSTRLEGERGIVLLPEPEVAQHLVEAGCVDPTLGARPLRNAVRRLVEEPVAEAILAGKFGRGDSIRISVQGNHLAFERAVWSKA